MRWSLLESGALKVEAVASDLLSERVIASSMVKNGVDVTPPGKLPVIER
jgi:hypothetical protein